MATVLTDNIAVWSEVSEAKWFDHVIYDHKDFYAELFGEAEEGSPLGLTSTDIVCERLELFGSPFREPLIARHEPAPVKVYDLDVIQPHLEEMLSQRAFKALNSAPLSKREVKAIRREYKLEQLALEERLKTQHFAAELAPLPPSPPRIRDKMFRALFQSQLLTHQEGLGEAK